MAKYTEIHIFARSISSVKYFANDISVMSSKPDVQIFPIWCNGNFPSLFYSDNCKENNLNIT